MFSGTEKKLWGSNVDFPARNKCLRKYNKCLWDYNKCLRKYKKCSRTKINACRTKINVLHTKINILALNSIVGKSGLSFGATEKVSGIFPHLDRHNGGLLTSMADFWYLRQT